MLVFMLLVCLLDQNQAGPLPREPESLQLVLQPQLDQTSPSPPPDFGQQRTSSSSSSSSSVSSESSQSSEEPQQLLEGQPENTAMEQTDSSQESLDRPHSSSNLTVLWLDELVSLGERVGEQDPRERDIRGDSVERHETRRLTPMLNFHPDLSRPQGASAAEEGVVTGHVGVAAADVVTGYEGRTKPAETDTEFHHLPDDSHSWDLPDHAHHHDYHGNKEEGLELGL